ncbi:tRNA pseudouridine(55) synthase TruB [Ferrovum sp. PN-J185]|uniref:tRNA pseudouridine(55) synthase TruB n=1 Tax=Ferrovum sp. PN-J185 TaxID=1356306 RepID=UPI00079BE11B|nr:tRNA pseudouridine(55) synthase TruB [Ferrovum sp. PN-J185]KXW55193.1 tRNA pseudouridine synthase B [Ferrovum sp. PN-J185]MCC6069320.1 tRNA pseudouridine(55) synthase TruB [Ferrovum sp. PN-J185]MDE1891558.1 tRNA pseudouridine(55) synthase TruB [Betaproteobacteria bacterium]MDE2055892.1 tRNA pseudouridine(55) synthase TruB [Betaproteobacteria bacterium]
MTVNIPKTNAVQFKAPFEEVSGVLLLNKPFGLTSNTALQRARHLLRAKKAGHTGTLDPHATGLLPLCFGEATKFSQWILDAPKGYIATLKLGYVSDTLDGEGVISKYSDVNIDLSQVEGVLNAMIGVQHQTPPMHAAIKVQGKPLYSYARSGQTIERQPRVIDILRCRLISLDTDLLTIECLVSKGTYIRVMASDIGEKLGCGAYLTALQRVSTGPYQLHDAVELSDLMAMSETKRRECLLPSDSLLSGVSSLHLDSVHAEDMKCGRIITLSEYKPLGLYKVYDPLNCFLGLCELFTENKLRPIRLMATHTQK